MSLRTRWANENNSHLFSVPLANRLRCSCVGFERNATDLRMRKNDFLFCLRSVKISKLYKTRPRKSSKFVRKKIFKKCRKTAKNANKSVFLESNIKLLLERENLREKKCSPAFCSLSFYFFRSGFVASHELLEITMKMESLIVSFAIQNFRAWYY